MSEVNIAKLMYYINAVNTCINIKVDSKFLSYLNADRLTEQEKVDVVALAAHYRPNVMKNLTFFEVGNDQISSKLNRFVALNDPYVRDELQLSSAVVFDNTKLKLRKVMLHTSEFFSDFFEIPFEAEEWRISSTSHTTIQTDSKPNKHHRYHHHAGSDASFWVMNGLVYCLLVLPVSAVWLYKKVKDHQAKKIEDQA